MKPQNEKCRSIQGASLSDWPRKPYAPPQIIHETQLEVRAGSPLGLDPLEDLLSIEMSE